jgi:hypothetical protein
MKILGLLLLLVLIYLLLEVFFKPKKTKTSIDDNVGIKGFIVAVLRDGRTGEIKQVIETHNIVTDTGDTYYAQMAAGEVPTNDFGNLVLGSGAQAIDKANDYSDFTPIANTNKAVSANYPKSNDNDVNNSGKAVDAVTWKFEWTMGDFNHAAITQGLITIAAPVAGSPLLCHFSFGGAFEKTDTDTLTIYVNHGFNGN